MAKIGKWLKLKLSRGLISRVFDWLARLTKISKIDNKMEYIILFFLFLVVATVLSMVLAGLSAAPWVPTFSKDVRHVINNFDFKPGSVFFDLGSGDGRMLRLVATQPNVKKAVGYEISLFFWLYAWLRKLFSIKGHKIELHFKSLFRADLTNADVVFCFLMPVAMDELEKKFALELRSGSVLISSTFKLKNKQPKAIISRGENKFKFFVYQY